MATNHPLFIYRYMDRNAPRGDSARFRVRLRAAFPSNESVQGKVDGMLKSEAGIKAPRGHYGVRWEDFFTSNAMEEVLTCVTLTYVALRNSSYSHLASPYKAAVEKALAEEHMGYRIDEAGSIHYAVDEVFEGMRAATLAALNDPVLAVSRGLYEGAFDYMDRHPPDTKAAVRSMFEALEVVARQLQPAARNLHANLCRNQLRDQYVAGSQGDPVEQRVWAGMFEGMAHWVQAMHEYRHGQVDNLAAPTEEFAVYVLSSGSAYLRLIAQLAIRVGVQPLP